MRSIGLPGRCAAMLLSAALPVTAVAQPPPESVRYTYDAAGRLVAAALPGADATYSWDAAGNRTAVIVTELTAPVVESISPSAGTPDAPTLFHVRGRGFLTASGAPTITWLLSGNVMGTATSVAIVNDSLIVAVGPTVVGVPPQSSPLVYDVSVTFPGGGTQTLASAYRSVSLALSGPADDLDGDGMPDVWEARHGTDLQVNDALQDSDADGVSNLDEYLGGTLPRGGHVRYLAEGATGSFFDDRIALLNPSDATADVLLRFAKTDGTTVKHLLRLDGRTRGSLDPKTVPGLATAEFSTVIESSEAIIVDRTMSWDASGYGSHAETSVAAPALEWYLAEGATHSGFDLFYLIQNPTAVDATVSVRYLRPAPAAPLTRSYAVAANSRFNIWVDQESPELVATDVSAVITSSQPVIVERAMYLSGRSRTFDAGHESAGVTQPARSWFLAEGATGEYFDLFILVANPNDRPTDVRATYLLEGGTTYQKTYTVGADSRFNIWADLEEIPAGSGRFPLANVAVSTIVESLDVSLPIIVERAMWWPGGAATWHEAHNSPGTTSAGTMWAVADGESGGDRASETYLLVANTSAFAGQARVTVYYENGTSERTTVDLAPSSRTNVVPAALFAGTTNQRFATMVESVDTGSGLPLIVVERAMYSTAGDTSWAAGTDAVATRLR